MIHFRGLKHLCIALMFSAATMTSLSAQTLYDAG